MSPSARPMEEAVASGEAMKEREDMRPELARAEAGEISERWLTAAEGTRLSIEAVEGGMVRWLIEAAGAGG